MLAYETLLEFLSDNYVTQQIDAWGRRNLWRAKKRGNWKVYSRGMAFKASSEGTFIHKDLANLFMWWHGERKQEANVVYVDFSTRQKAFFSS